MLTREKSKLPLKVNRDVFKSMRCLCLLKGIRRLGRNMALVHTHYFKSAAHKHACDKKKKTKQNSAMETTFDLGIRQSPLNALVFLLLLLIKILCGHGHSAQSGASFPIAAGSDRLFLLCGRSARFSGVLELPILTLCQIKHPEFLRGWYQARQVPGALAS